MRAPHRTARGLLALPAVAVAVLAAVLTGAAPASASPVEIAPTPSATASSGAGSAVAATASCVTDEQTACIRGTLKDANANPVRRIQVRISGPGGSASATSNVAGQFVFTLKKAGPYRITVAVASLPKGLKVAAPSRTVQANLGELTPAPFSVTGTFKGSKAAEETAGGTLGLVWSTASGGLLLGLLLALASIGLSLIYGTTGLSNFAHAEQVTLGGILVYVFAIQLALNFLVAAAISIVLCAASGYLQDRLIWGPLRRRGLGLTQLTVVTIGLSLALEYAYQYSVGASVYQVTRTIQTNTGPLSITPNAYLAMLISIVILIAIGIILQRTRIGRATRAVSDNRALAAASGIDVDRVIRLVWTVSMGLAGLSGILYALVYGGIAWNTGQALLLLIFSAVTLGGLGTAFGALVGSLVIGLVVELSGLVLSSDLRYASALLILILVLILRPQGILGRRERVG